LDTQLLKAFLAVAESGSFSAAADKIHLTQPAISKRIALLEEQLNTRLFDRIARQVSLTEAGLALLPRAELILREIANTQQLIDDLSGEVTGRLRLAISHHIGLHRLPPILKEFTRRYQDVAIDVDFMDSEKAYEAVLHDKFEVAAITLALKPHEKIAAHCVWPDPLVFMAAKRHPLTRLPKKSLEALCRYPAIIPSLSTYTGRIIRKLFEERGLPLKTALDTNYLETIKMMTTIGLGWSVLPASMLDGELVKLEIPDVSLIRNLGYIHHREKTLSNAARAFIKLLDSV